LLWHSSELEQLAYGIQAEAESSRMANEPDAANIRHVVGPPVAIGSRWRRQ
jgi:hypothetical protein